MVRGRTYNGQNHDQGGGNHRQAGSYSVDDDFLVVGEIVGCQDNDCEDHCNTKKTDSKLG
jgi:ribosomal protein L2